MEKNISYLYDKKMTLYCKVIFLFSQNWSVRVSTLAVTKVAFYKRNNIFFQKFIKAWHNPRKEIKHFSLVQNIKQLLFSD
jgi:hypothetical protein